MPRASIASTGAPARQPAFDAFISYSHAADGRLAPALQRDLRRFAKPYPRAGRRMFRDETGLALTESLWPDIRAAIEQSRTFILLASPDAARSDWVVREVALWLELGRGLPFLVLTAGEAITWRDGKLGSDAVPPQLCEAYTTEPKWLDLRWAREDRHLGRRDVRYHHALAMLAAAIDGRSLESILDLDAFHRRALVAAVSLVVLSLVTLASLAWLQAVEAERTEPGPRDAALVRVAESLVSADPTRGALVFASIEGDREPAGAVPLASRLAQQPLATVLRGHTTAVTWATYSPDGRRIVTTSGDSVRVWAADGRASSIVLSHAGLIGKPMFSPDGSRIVGVGSRVHVWTVNGAAQGDVDQHSGNHQAEFAGNGRWIFIWGGGVPRVARADGEGPPGCWMSRAVRDGPPSSS